jgi:hypothetical protein
MTLGLEEMEVFQNLNLKGDPAQLAALREALIKQVAPPWSRLEDDEARLSRIPGKTYGLVLHRSPDAGIPGAKLFLVGMEESYRISNIVPLEVGELGRSGYNAVLQDFASRIANPAAAETGAKIEITPPRQTLDDWVIPTVARALRAFSSLANKSTGSAHPMDLERWLDFIAKAHDSGNPLGTDQLMRWLVEVEKWPEREASDLVSQYGFGLDLLDYVKK